MEKKFELRCGCKAKERLTPQGLRYFISSACLLHVECAGSHITGRELARLRDEIPVGV